MGIYLNRYLLRNDYLFDVIVEEVARDHAKAILAEDPETPYHEARAAMARLVIDGPVEDERRRRFVADLKDRGARESAFLTPAFQSPIVGDDGISRPNAGNIPDETLISGVRAVWNDAAVFAWPTIVDDTATEAMAQDPERIRET